MSSYWSEKVAIVTGASSGLGWHLSRALVRVGARVVMAARNEPELNVAARDVSIPANEAMPIVADVTQDESVTHLVGLTVGRLGRIDAVFNCAGRSMRKAAIDTTADDFRELIDLNFLGAVRMARATVPELVKTRGHLVNIGSLAGKLGTRYYGAYPASKFCLSAYSQQLRLELGPQGLHVLLVCPGPIRRDNASPRYAEAQEKIPADALKPGGGAKVRAIDPERLAVRILDACLSRKLELVVPCRARVLFAIGQLAPRLGDWLLRKLT